MTIEEAKFMVPIIQAWGEGKTVQFRYPPHDWHDVPIGTNPFVDKCVEWRVKPEPREFIIHKPINSLTTSDVFLYTVGKSQCATPGSKPGYEIIHVREVL